MRNTIRKYYRADEDMVVKELLPLAKLCNSAQIKVDSKAVELAKQVRCTAQKSGNIQNLLNQYALSTDEGIVLMCLAEALLRVPDSTTADRLIRDKLLTGNWSSHIGSSESFFVNASSWGLLLSGEVVSFNKEDQEIHINNLKKSIGKLGEPVIRIAMRQAMGIMGTQFVLGRTIKEAGSRAKKKEVEGYRYSFDMLGEAARTMEDADVYFDAYKEAIKHYDQIISKIDVNSQLYAEILYRRGGCYERLGDYVSSDKDLLKSLEIKPDDAYVLNYLAYSWLEREYKIDLSLQMLEKAYNKKSNDPYIIDSIGWAYYLVNDYVKAENFLKRAVELMPEDPTVNDHYGDILWKLDRRIQARYFWKNVLNIEETDDEMKKIIKNKLIEGLTNS